jgi:hypothetical protein
VEKIIVSKTVLQKLPIKENFEILILNGPDGYRVVGKLLSNVSIHAKTKDAHFDVIQAF